MTDNQISAAEDSVVNGEPDDEISLLDFAIVLAQRKRLLIVFPLVIGIVATIYVLTLPNIYTATTRILPPQQNRSIASAILLAQTGGLVGGQNSGVGGLYIGMLKSRTVADNLIQRFDLNEYCNTKRQSVARDCLARDTSITSGRDGIIVIEVDNKDPKRAADIANAYVDELYKLTDVLAITDASQQRLFYEKQLAIAKENLANAEAAAREALSKGGIAMVDAQGQTMIGVTEGLRGQIAVKEVQIGIMRNYAAEDNPELKAAQQALGVMKDELAKLEGSRGEINDESSNNAQGVDSVSLLRDVKYSETVYDLLAKQYEAAKIDEAKDASLIQVLDKAVVPDNKSKPLRRLIVILWILIAFILSVIWIFVEDRLAKARQNPDQAPKLQELLALLSFRR